VDGSIIGAVVAQNTGERDVLFPADVVVTRSFDGPQLDPDGTPQTSVLDNRADESVMEPASVQSVTLTGPGAFEFERVPRGIHEVSFSDEDGFTTPSTNDSVVVDGAVPYDLGEIV